MGSSPASSTGKPGALGGAVRQVTQSPHPAPESGEGLPKAGASGLTLGSACSLLRKGEEGGSEEGARHRFPGWPSCCCPPLGPCPRPPLQRPGLPQSPGGNHPRGSASPAALTGVAPRRLSLQKQVTVPLLCHSPAQKGMPSLEQVSRQYKGDRSASWEGLWRCGLGGGRWEGRKARGLRSGGCRSRGARAQLQTQQRWP